MVKGYYPEGSLLIRLNPTIQPDQAVNSALQSTAEFRKTVQSAGYLEFDSQTITELNSLGLLSETYKGPELPTALRLHALGVKHENLVDEADKATFLLEEEKQQFYNTAYIMAAFEEANPEQFITLQTANLRPTITIQQAPPEFVPQRNQFTLERRGEGGFQPIKEVLGKGTDYAKDKVKDFASRAIKEGGEKLLEKGTAVAAKAGVKVAAKTGVKAGITTATQALGTTVPVLGNIAAYIATEVGSRVLGGIKKTFGKIGELLTGERDIKKQLAYLGAGLFLLVSTTVSAILAPLIIAILVTPLIVAFFLFIINSGAYLVPPEPSFIPGGGGSPYIGVEKTADPSGPFSNDVLSIGDGLRITYTITITAKKGSLTNINYDYSCTVIADHEETCPAIGNVTANGESVSNFQEAMPEEISPVGGPYVIAYEQLFKERFKDTATVDTFTITADAEGKPGEKASASEAIVIGNPPLGCFVFSGFKENDPDYGNFLAAAAKLSSHVNYIVKLCTAGDITVKRNYTGTGRGACAGVSGSNLMFFNNCVYYSSHGQAFIDYLFAHESGHIYDHRTSDLSRFITEGIMSEGGLPTYCITQPPPPNEDFADTIGDYVDNGNLGRLCEHNDQRPFHICGGSWPRHCEFARNVIFEE